MGHHFRLTYKSFSRCPIITGGVRAGPLCASLQALRMSVCESVWFLQGQREGEFELSQSGYLRTGPPAFQSTGKRRSFPSYYTCFQSGTSESSTCCVHHVMCVAPVCVCVSCVFLSFFLPLLFIIFWLHIFGRNKLNIEIK